MTQHILEDATIPELPGHYKGKVRDCYDLPDNIRIMITTDRLSAFDRHICAVPEKGRVLTKCSALWFQRMADICPNHVLDYPDSNVLICKRLQMIPIEVVVRDYLAGNTDTSILQMYKNGKREIYGYTLPNKMKDNERLPFTMITPTSKDVKDVPLRATSLDHYSISSERWTEICRTSLALFAKASEMVAKNGLILVDTKFEFGIDENGVLTLADEIFTPDSSRYWFAETYQEALETGTPPLSFDKDFLRHWIAKRCDPYTGPLPEIPQEMIDDVSAVYIDAYERITGMIYSPYCADIPILNRIRAALHLAGLLEIH